MKHFFLPAILVMFCSVANATIHTVTCQNTPVHFLPLTVNAVSGDTIHWVWVEGNHIVGPVNASDIPNGANTWNGYIDAGHLSYDYVVTVPGTYNYDCHPATPHGEEASIIVSGTTGINQYNLATHFSAYPNPSNGMFQLEMDENLLSSNSMIEIYDLQGKIIYQARITAAITAIDLHEQASETYLVKFYTGEAILTRKIEIR